MFGTAFSFVTNLFGGIWVKLAIAGAIVITILGIILRIHYKGVSEGKLIEKAKQNELRTKVQKQSKAIEKEFTTKSDDDVVKWLRDKRYIRTK